MARRKKDAVTLAADRLKLALERQYEAGASIKREGNQLVVPEFMEYKDAIKALEQHMKEMETEVAREERFVGHPSDTLNAVYEGLTEVFGHIVGAEDTISMLFFSMKIPGQSREIQIGYDEFKNVPYGKLEIPGLPVSIYLEVNDNENNVMESVCVMHFECKKKYQPLVTTVTRAVRDYLKKNSIFKGKAIDSQFNFINLDQAPLERIVYSQREELQLEAELFNILRKRVALKRAKRPLKRTILLSGNYGTGKTLTALKAAVESEQNGWTFIQVRPKDSITASIEFAKKYQPCMVFFEDVDQVTHGTRDQDMNEVLNTIDGMLNKDTEVVVVLTTNRVNRIEKAMIRPGRIDTMIEMGHIDEQAILGHVKAQLGEQIEGELDTDALVNASDGYTPAFVVEALNKTWLYTLQRTGSPSSEITSDDIVFALENLRPQFDIMMGEQEVDHTSAGDMLVSDIVEKVDGKILQLKESFDPRVLKE